MSEPEWRAAAEERIRTHRIGTCRIELRRDGRPLAHAQVAVRQQANAVLFGSCVSDLLVREGEDARRYRDFVINSCNAVVCENAMKWYATEAAPEAIDYAPAEAVCAFAAAHGLRVRGHCLTWSKRKFVQEWVAALDPAALRAAVERHVRRSVARFAGSVCCWDGNNEMLDGSFYRDRLGSGYPAWLHRLVAETAADTPVFCNEYGVLDDDERLARYCELIAAIRAAGAPVGGIGIQEHACERFAADDRAAAADADRPERQGRDPLIPAAVWRRFDRCAQTGLPIHITEVSCKTDDPQRRALALDQFLHTAYAHPAVAAFMLWGFWSRRHWLGTPAALFTDDWTPTPAGELWMERIGRTWRSSADRDTDAGGHMDFIGHYGRYTLSVDGVATPFTHAPGAGTLQLAV